MAFWTLENCSSQRRAACNQPVRGEYAHEAVPIEGHRPSAVVLGDGHRDQVAADDKECAHHRAGRSVRKEVGDVADKDTNRGKQAEIPEHRRFQKSVAACQVVVPTLAAFATFPFSNARSDRLSGGAWAGPWPRLRECGTGRCAYGRRDVVPPVVRFALGGNARGQLKRADRVSAMACGGLAD